MLGLQLRCIQVVKRDPVRHRGHEIRQTTLAHDLEGVVDELHDGLGVTTNKPVGRARFQIRQ